VDEEGEVTGIRQGVCPLYIRFYDKPIFHSRIRDY